MREEEDDAAFVVIFPSEPSRHRMGQLASNIKKILRIREQGFGSVKRDGDIIVVCANDPVFASSAINQLFGISRVAIARRAQPAFESVVATAAELGGNLLLRGERFLVRVEGDPRGFAPKDAEIAITSSIIEKRSGHGSSPGSEGRHDKLLYTYITKKSAYVCIFLDGGHGGIPNLSHGQKTVCPVYDGVSAISCIEAIKQGYQTKIIAVYRTESELTRIAKLLNRIIRFVPQAEIELEFYSFGPGQKTGNRHDLQSLITWLCLAVARDGQIPKISLPVTSGMFSVGYTDAAHRLVHESGLLLHLPLEGREDRIGEMAREYALDKFLRGGIRIQRGAAFSDVSEARFRDNASSMAKTRRVISARFGPNSLHDILDGLGKGSLEI